MLVSSLERAGSSAPWDEYVALGAAEATWVLSEHPELTTAVAHPALLQAPDATIPRLLDLAVGDERPLHSNLKHPLRILDVWVQGAEPGTDQAVPRRKRLIKAVTTWVSAGGDEGVALRALCIAMAPDFEDTASDPGSGTRFTMRFGLLLPDELLELQGSWDRVLELIDSFGNVAWKHLLDLVRDWAYPNPQIKGVEGQIEAMRRFVRRLLSDIARIANGHPGVLHRISEKIRELDHTLEVSLDAEFETLFPEDRFEEDYRPIRERQVTAVREMAGAWSPSDPVQVARRIHQLESAADDVGLRHPRYTPLLSEEIAERTERPSDWLRALLDEQVAGDLVAPFLDRAARANEGDWEEAAYSMLEDPSLRYVASVVALTLPNPPPRLLSATLAQLDGLDNLVEWNSAMGRIPKATLALLLAHEDPKISAAAALGEWRAAPRPGVRSDLRSAWQAAILASDIDEHGLGEVLKEDRDLAYDWLLRRLAHSSSIGLVRLEHAVADAVSVLDREQRLSVLRTMRRSGSGSTALALGLVDDDLDLYKQFLQDEELSSVHLLPLAGRPRGLWPEKAKLALAAGFSAEAVGISAFGDGVSWSGSESAMWSEWAVQFASLCSHEDAGVRAASQVGRSHAQQRREEALERERLESIYGRF